MPNTDCFPPCEPYLRTIPILGTPVLVKDYACSEDGCHYKRKPDHIKMGLSIVQNAFCPASCPFCIATQTKTDRRIDPRKLETALRALKAEDRLYWITITGGEPFYDLPLLDETVSMITEIMGDTVELSVDTNGMNIDRIHEIKHLSGIDTIHVSRHHYLDPVNDSIFGMTMPCADALREVFHSVSFPDIFVINCMLQKGFIDSPDEVHTFLDHAIDLGAPKVSFITAAPCNPYAARIRIPFEQVLRRDDPTLLFTRGYVDHTFCRCDDGIYLSPRGDLIEFYGRSTNTQGLTYCRGLTYSYDNTLRTGFDGSIIPFGGDT